MNKKRVKQYIATDEEASVLAILAQELHGYKKLTAAGKKAMKEEIELYLEIKAVKDSKFVRACINKMMGVRGKYTQKVEWAVTQLNAWVKQLGHPKSKSCPVCRGTGHLREYQYVDIRVVE